MTVPNWHVNWRQLECLQATFEPSPLEIYNEKKVSSVDTEIRNLLPSRHDSWRQDVFTRQYRLWTDIILKLL